MMIGRKAREEDDEEEEEDPWKEAEYRSAMKLWRTVRSPLKFLAKRRRLEEVIRQGPREYLPYAVARRPAVCSQSLVYRVYF